MRGTTPETLRATGAALAAALVLVALVVPGSRTLAFDAARVDHLFATLFGVSGITSPYAMWRQRSPTTVDWRRGTTSSTGAW